MSQGKRGRLVVVSNRLPITLVPQPPAGWQVRASHGGLATALAAALRGRGGLWIGWPGITEDADLEKPFADFAKANGYELLPVPLTPDEEARFYRGFSNEIIWPLFHDLQTFCNFRPEYWTTYEDVNRRFAQVIAEEAGPQDYIWVHDYHLMNVARELRGMVRAPRVGFFLHIPFPPLDIFLKLPWRYEVFQALMQYDLLGFQTPRDLANFVHCAKGMFAGTKVEEEGPRLVGVRSGGRRVVAGTFPISIDHKEFVRRSAEPAVVERARRLHEQLPNRQFILGVDRLDYTKGLPAKFEAFAKALERYPELQRRVSLIQVVSPSRSEIPRYSELKSEVERLVGEINGTFTQLGWVPIHYIHRNLDAADLLAFYRASDVALVTPLKDGMNLVAKEYVACRAEEDGVLVLSEFAGAADQLGDAALLVNPYDTDTVAAAIYEAFRMPRNEQRRRMQQMRSVVAREDIAWWVESHLRAAGIPPTAGAVVEGPGVKA